MDRQYDLHDHSAINSPESKASSPNGGGDKPKQLRVVERGSQACNECRRHKIRCHPAPDDPEHVKPCARCVRMGLECIFKKHNRGRKRKNPLAELHSDAADSPAAKRDYETAAQNAGSRPHPHAASGAPSFWNRGASPDRGIFSMSTVSRYPFMTLETPRDLEAIHAGPSRPQASIPQSMSLRSMVHQEPWEGEEDDSVYTDTELRHEDREAIDRSPVDVRHDIDRRPASSNAYASNGHLNAGDPVSLGYLTLEEAKTLFTVFVRNFNNALPLLDPIVHTHDWVRRQSPFLYTVIMCITSRHMSSVGHEPVPLSHNHIHQQIVILARDHLMWAFAEAAHTIDVVQAIVALCLWKEPDDDKAAYYFNRAVVLAKELDLGRDPPAAEYAHMSPSQRLELRHRQRLWMSIFSTNSIFHMQFRQPMLISHTDPLISSCTFWVKRAAPEHVLMDTFVAFSADLRRRFLQYRELLEGPTPSALALAVMTRTMNKDWENTVESWIREIIDAGGSPAYIHKPRVWYSSLGLNLNLMILNQTLRIPPAERIPPAPSATIGTLGQMRSIPAFHHCLNAASSVLLRFTDLDTSQLTFASDTLLHFALYAATFLWTLCRTPEQYDFETSEVEYTRDLILKVAETLDAASSYPSSSPALHAKYLRRLCRGRGASRSESLTMPTQMEYGGPPREPNAAMGDLDFLLGDFPWTGMDVPWPPVDPALFGQGGSAAGAGAHAHMPPQYENGARSPRP